MLHSPNRWIAKRPVQRPRKADTFVASVVPRAGSSCPPKATIQEIEIGKRAPQCSSDTTKAARRVHGTGTCRLERGPSGAGAEGPAEPRRPSWMYVFGVVSLVPAAQTSALSNCTGKHEPCRTPVTHTLSLSLLEQAGCPEHWGWGGGGAG